jgi:uncharacterized protein YgiM (DUF1202 family)
LLCLCVLAGCSSRPEREREIGEAYVGPATLKLRREMDLRSAEAATVVHGERLAIVRRRRRFVKVRTEKGVEGWTDTHLLLSSEQMEQLNQLAERARSLPSQGAATVYEALNVHTEPNRMSPSFYRVKEHEPVDVVERDLIPRVPFEPKRILPPPKPPAARKPKPEPPTGRIPPPPMPPPPKVPADWLELSESTVGEADTQSPVPPKPEPEPAKPVPLDDWTLIRLANGRAGWVLTGMLRMNIPDEVAQYSEGHRITSYLAMEDVKDEGQIKHNWLWTTLADTRQPYAFDSFRCFVWNVRRHRYETAYIEKNLRGYYPVEAHPVKTMAGKKEESYPGFSLIVEDDDGLRWRKLYGFHTYHVALLRKEKWEPAPSPPPDQKRAAASPKTAPAEPPGLLTRLGRTLAGWGRKLFGK